MKHAFVLLLLLVSVAGCYVPPKLPPDKEAPPFRGQAQDGKHYSLLDLLRRGPVLVVFGEEKCGPTREILPYLGVMKKAYGKRATVLVALHASEAATAAWAKSNRSPVPVFPDIEARFAEKYQFLRSPSMAVIGRNGAIEGRWEGFSKAALDESNDALARLLKAERAPVSFVGAPSEPKFGPEFIFR